MNQLSLARRAAIVRCLVEGNTTRGTSRLAGVSRCTVGRLLREMGALSQVYLRHVLRGLPCKRIGCDEIYSFIGCKKWDSPQKDKIRGAAWTWTAICMETKLIICWHTGPRTMGNALSLMRDLRERTVGRVQITTDALGSYPLAVEEAFGRDADYAAIDGEILGNPDPAWVSNSHVESHNGIMRSSLARFKRKGRGFSRTKEDHEAALALYFMHYNFCRRHSTLTKRLGRPATPAIAAGLTDHVWTAEELCHMAEPTVKLGVDRRRPDIVPDWTMRATPPRSVRAQTYRKTRRHSEREQEQIARLDAVLAGPPSASTYRCVCGGKSDSINGHPECRKAGAAA